MSLNLDERFVITGVDPGHSSNPYYFCGFDEDDDAIFLQDPIDDGDDRSIQYYSLSRALDEIATLKRKCDPHGKSSIQMTTKKIKVKTKIHVYF